MASIVPTTSDGSSIYRVRLLSETYLFNTYYNNTLSMWYLNLSDSEANPLALGAALVPNIDILRNFPPLTNTFGELRVLDLTGEGNATPTSLGDSAQLIFYEVGEFEATYPDYNSIDTKPLPYDFDEYFIVVPI